MVRKPMPTINERAPGVPWNAPDNFGGYNTTGMSPGKAKPSDSTGIAKPLPHGETNYPSTPQSGPQKPAEPVRR